MSNILSPIVARYSLFFTLTMFSSSVISQTSRPTHLVQTMLIEAQSRYQESATRKLRALIRNVSTTSTTSTSASKSSAFQSISTSTEFSSLSSYKAHPANETPSTRSDFPSFLPTASPTVSRTNVNAGPDPPRQHQPRLSRGITEKLEHISNGGTVAPPVQGFKVSRSAIATLLSVTLTMIILSLLQNKKRHIRRRTRSLREGPRRHRRSKHHRDEYKTYSLDRSTNPLYSQSSRTTALTLTDSMTESAHSPTLSHTLPNHFSGGDATKPDYGPTSYTPSYNVDSDHQSTAPSSPAMPNIKLGHNSSTPNLYGGNGMNWSLSDGHLPGTQTKNDLVAAWLTQQNFTIDTTNSYDATHHTVIGYNENIHKADRQYHSHHLYHRQHQSHDSMYDTSRETPNESRQYHRANQQYEYYNQSLPHLPRPVSPSLTSNSALDYPSQHYHRSRRQLVQPPSPHWQDQRHYSVHHYRPHRNIPEHGQARHSFQPPPHRYDIIAADGVGQDQGRSLSLTLSNRPRGQYSDHYIPSPPPKHDELSPAEQARHEHQLRRQWYQMHHQYIQQHRQHQQQHQQFNHHYRREHHHHAPNSNAHFYHTQSMAAVISGQPLSSHYSPESRTVNDLAWERHCYYQQQQHMEEALAERKRMEMQVCQEQQGLRQGMQQEMQQRSRQDGLSPPEPDFAAWTDSLNRLPSSSLSPNTAKALGLSRSRSLCSIFGDWGANSNEKRLSRGSMRMKSKASDGKGLSASFRHMRKNESKDLETANVGDDGDVEKDLSVLQPVPVSKTAAPLTRKSTLKSIAPSIRSLARRCSSRFGNRPYSFAGTSSDPDKRSEANDFNTPQILVSEESKIQDSQQTSQNMVSAVKRSLPTTPVTTTFQLLGAKPERVPVHRKVTLYRSKTMTHSSKPMLKANELITKHSRSATDGPSTILQTQSSPASPHSSLRLANGRGLDLPMVNSRPQLSDLFIQNVERSSNELEESLPTNESVLGHASELEQENEIRRQIIEILAMGRKERISARTGQAIGVYPESKLSTISLSPLALEAQEIPPIDPVEALNEEVDPCERIAFMLVPKSRYEFQPLIAV
ncbi:hypothetical protein BGX21_011599 [Mortierella sp. AD011]|nr:hypothetical protein BGX20_002847 [Mortierella sp. AD010]KAF9389873.1 hypothetical protein BGX21_011599 [Mortierella sp. AD011]